MRGDAVAQKAHERLRILGLDDFERRFVPDAKTPVGVGESGQGAPHRPLRRGERLEAEGADAIERRDLHRSIADPAAELVRRVRHPQVESGIAEGAGLLVDSQRSCRLVEPLDHLRAYRVEPELDALALAVAESRRTSPAARRDHGGHARCRLPRAKGSGRRGPLPPHRA